MRSLDLSGELVRICGLLKSTLEVCNHLQSNPNHRVDFNNPQILTSSPDKSKLLILESLCIQQLASIWHLALLEKKLVLTFLPIVICVSRDGFQG